MTGDRTPTGDLCRATTEGGAVGPCVLPLGHDETLHQGPDSKFWLPDVEVTITADVSGFENGVKDARIAALDLAVAMLTKRAEEAERQRDEALAAVQRVRDAAHIADVEDVTDWQRGYRSAMQRIVTALDQPEETPPAEHTGGNAEDCPVCRPSIDQPGGVLYPWTCPGPNPEDT